MSRRMKKGRTLYDVDYYEQVAKLITWTVTSVKRRPRRGWNWGKHPGGKRVYILCDYDDRRDSFSLEDWPSYKVRYAATPKGAWTKALRRIPRDIDEVLESLRELEGDEAWTAELQAELAMLHRGRTRAKGALTRLTSPKPSTTSA